MPKQKGPKRDKAEKNRIAALKAQKARKGGVHGGPFNGQSAVAYGAIVGKLIEVNHKSYRITKIEPVPGWRELVAQANYEEKPKVAVAVKAPVSTTPR